MSTSRILIVLSFIVSRPISHSELYFFLVKETRFPFFLDVVVPTQFVEQTSLSLHSLLFHQRSLVFAWACFSPLFHFPISLSLANTTLPWLPQLLTQGLKSGAVSSLSFISARFSIALVLGFLISKVGASLVFSFENQRD